MNINKTVSLYICDIQNDRVLIRSLDLHEPDASLNAHPSWKDNSLWFVTFDKQVEIPALLMKLRDKGLAFLELPSGWPPSAVFERLRKEGKVAGDYMTIIFEGDGRFQIQKK